MLTLKHAPIICIIAASALLQGCNKSDSSADEAPIEAGTRSEPDEPDAKAAPESEPTLDAMVRPPAAKPPQAEEPEPEPEEEPDEQEPDPTPEAAPPDPIEAGTPPTDAAPPEAPEAAAPTSEASIPDAAPPTGCAPISGPGVVHDRSLTASETWTAADSPHIVRNDIRVEPGATLVIEPCAEIRLANQARLTARGSILAEGTAEQPIRFVADNPSQPWGRLVAQAPGTVSLAYATLQDGGNENVGGLGMLEGQGDQTLPGQEVIRVNHVTLDRSVSYGVSMPNGAVFTQDSQALTITNSQKAAIRTLPRLVSTIPTGTFTGNGPDAIELHTVTFYGDVAFEDVTFHDRGIPYIVGGGATGGDMRVGNNSRPVTLTIEPGVVLAFVPGGDLLVNMGANNTGVLIAVGTADKPIVFTSAATNPQPGDWLGIYFRANLSPNSRMDHVEVRYAGGSTGGGFCRPIGLAGTENGAISILDQPTTQFITNTLVSDSAGLGINLAYRGTFVDFEPTNTFTNVSYCVVSYPPDANGVCPADPPCAERSY